MAYEKRDRSKPAKITIDFDGKAFRSGFECRARECLDIWHMNYEHEFLEIRDLMCGKARYSPDFTLFYPDSSEIKPALLETKGFVDPDSEVGVQTFATWNQFRKRVQKNEFSMFVRAWCKDRIEVYEYPYNETESGAVYECPQCGWVDFYAVKRHTCRMCGHEDTSFVTKNLNQFANDFFLPVWTANVKKAHQEVKEKLEQQRKAARWEKVAVNRFKAIAGAYPNFDFVTNAFKIRTPFNDNASFSPTGSYTEQRTDRAVFGTAFAPTALVIIDDYETYNDQEVYGQLMEYIDHRNTMFTKIIFVNRDGILVYDESNHNKEEGGFYECPECGKAFIAKHSNHNCPCCDSKKTVALDTKKAVA